MQANTCEEMQCYCVCKLNHGPRFPKFDWGAVRAQMLAWPQRLASLVTNQLFEKYEPHNTVSMIDMNTLKQNIGLPTPDSNPQIMFEQIASLENQFKTYRILSKSKILLVLYSCINLHILSMSLVKASLKIQKL